MNPEGIPGKNEKFDSQFPRGKEIDLHNPKISPQERNVLNEFVAGKVDKSEYHRKIGSGNRMWLQEKALDSLKHPVISEFFGGAEKFVEKAFPDLSQDAQMEVLKHIERLEEQFDSQDIAENATPEDYVNSEEFREISWWIDRWFGVCPENAVKYLPNYQQSEDFH